MARLYVRNVPDEQYQALRHRARENHRSIAAEVIAMFEEALLSRQELEARCNAAKKTTKKHG